MSFADVLAVMYPLSTPRERVAMADATAPPRDDDVVGGRAHVHRGSRGDLSTRGFGRERRTGRFRVWEVLRELGVDDAEEREAMFREMDTDGGGTVSWEEFREWWFGEGAGEDE